MARNIIVTVYFVVCDRNRWQSREIRENEKLTLFAFYDQFWNIRLESFNDRYLVSFEKKGKSNNRNLIRNKHPSDMFTLEQYFN